MYLYCTKRAIIMIINDWLPSMTKHPSSARLVNSINQQPQSQQQQQQRQQRSSGGGSHSVA
jgi:hypothetical protein